MTGEADALSLRIELWQTVCGKPVIAFTGSADKDVRRGAVERLLHAECTGVADQIPSSSMALGSVWAVSLCISLADADDAVCSAVISCSACSTASASDSAGDTVFDVIRCWPRPSQMARAASRREKDAGCKQNKMCVFLHNIKVSVKLDIGQKVFCTL